MIVAVNDIRYFGAIELIEKFFESDKMVSMKNKPLIFTILSILCFIEPIIKILYFKAMTDFDFVVIFANLKARNSFIEVIDFWLIFPIAGLLILKLRKWSYFSFMGILAYIIYNILTYEKYTWPYNSDSPFMYHYLVALTSTAVFLYFLSPKAREPFFDRRIRWWEPKTRYNVQITCKLHGDHVVFPSEILNISQTGAFVMESSYLKVGDKLLMQFNFLGQHITVPVEVMNEHSIHGHTGFGLRFKFSSLAQSIRMGKVISILKKSHNAFKVDKIDRFAA